MGKKTSCIHFVDPNAPTDMHTRVYLSKPTSSSKPHPPLAVAQWLSAAAEAVTGSVRGRRVNRTTLLEKLAHTFCQQHSPVRVSHGVFTHWIDFLYRVAVAGETADGVDSFVVSILRYNAQRHDPELVCERLPLSEAVARLAGAAECKVQRKKAKRAPPATR